MKKILITLILTVLLGGFLSAEITANEGDSVVEFPTIVLVGQIVEITPYSVIFENTYADTGVTNEQIKNLVKYYSSSLDFRAHAFANSLKVVHVKDGKMRLAFYLDNITKVFDDDVKNYMKFIPLFYLFKNNLNQLKVSDKIREELKKKTLDYYLNLSMVKDLMAKSWLAGVFKIDSDSGKLVYYASRLYNNMEDLKLDDWARENRIFDIIKTGMTMTMSKARVVGRGSSKPEEEDDSTKDGKGGVKGKDKFYNEKFDGNGEAK